jgi:hypothetical protein
MPKYNGMTHPNGNGNGARRTQRIQQPPPQTAVPPLPVLQQELQAKIPENQARLQRLAQQGTPIDPASLLHSRIDQLIDSIAQFAGPEGGRWAALTRLQFEQWLARTLEEVEGGARKSLLAQGAQFTPGMIAALARESGTFGAHPRNGNF